MNNQRPHIALIGFMGSGKTTLGKILAARINLEFLDLDAEIERATGESISEIFSKYGETTFRIIERTVLDVVLENAPPAVIATGGGTFCDPLTRKRLREKTQTVYLKVDLNSVLSRVTSPAEQENRPLLNRSKPDKDVADLLARRLPDYEEAEFTVETSATEVSAVLNQLLSTLDMLPPDKNMETKHHVLRIDSSAGPYLVEFRQDAGDWIAKGIAALAKTPRVVIITDSTVESLHASSLVTHLSKSDIKPTLLVFPAGEQSKTLETASRLYDDLLGLELTREDLLVALGGGVVGDVTGFVASTFLRGIDYVQVPTTTLAAVDSSVGGKTAVNTPLGKNLVGTFHPPKGVFIAISHLATQQRSQHGAGLVEALKMSATMDAALFKSIVATAPELLNFAPDILLPVLHQSIELKARVVTQDEEERGVRAVLNYGHTVGHVIEKGEHFQLLHGTAVGLGMIAEAEFGLSEGTTEEVLNQLLDGLRALEMPTAWKDFSHDLDALTLDKKRLGTGKSVKLPIITTLGAFEFRSIPIFKLKDYLLRRVGT